MANEQKPPKRPNQYKKLYVGQVIKGGKGETYEVVRHHFDRFYLVRFHDTGTLQFVSSPQASRAFDRSKPYIDGIGYMSCGDNPIFLHDKETKDIYNRWMNMLHRCYKNGTGYKTWQGVTVCEEWHNFFNFFNWAKGQPFLLDNMWQIDKDLFSDPNHKMYSPETCCFIPNGLNSQLVNMNYDEIHNPTPSPRIRHICEHMSRLLLKNEQSLAPRVLDLLWKVCDVNGISHETAKLQVEFQQMQTDKEKLEKQVAELTAANQTYAQKDLDGQYMRDRLSAMPIRGFVEHMGKLYRLESANDLRVMLNNIVKNMNAAPLPSG